MVEFQIVEYCNIGMIVDKFRTLIKKSGVVFIRFDYKNVSTAVPG